MGTRLEEKINRWVLVLAAAYFGTGVVLRLMKRVDLDSILLLISRWFPGP